MMGAICTRKSWKLITVVTMAVSSCLVVQMNVIPRTSRTITITTVRVEAHDGDLDQPVAHSANGLEQEMKAQAQAQAHRVDQPLNQRVPVDLSDEDMSIQGQDLHGDSSTATVIGTAIGYQLQVFERFVGTLRKSGFKGHIILGLAPDVSQEILDYLAYRRVTPKILRWTNCTYNTKGMTNQESLICEEHYPNIKIRWSRFPLAADWLRECKTCTGPVLFTDVRDAYFQLDPFGPGSPVISGLQLTEEDARLNTTHWITSGPIRQCKNMTLDKPMLNSGSTIGTRAAMLEYFGIMYNEMKMWSSDLKCLANLPGGDQAIHNYMYYTGRLPSFTTVVRNRSGGIVNNVGFDGIVIYHRHVATMKARFGIDVQKAIRMPYDGAIPGKTWIDTLAWNITDEDGFFTEFDGSRSRVIHQWDRFGLPFILFRMANNTWFKDPRHH